MKKYKIGERLEDGSIIKKLYFFNYEKGFIIFLDQNKEIKYRIVNTLGYSFKINLPLLQVIQNEILEIPNWFRKDLNSDLAFYFRECIIENDMSLENIESKKMEIQTNLENLQNKIKERKKFLKKIVYLITPIFLTCILLNSILVFDIKFLNKDLILYSFLGNFISIFKNINKIEFQSAEEFKSYIIFAALKYFQAIICSYLLVYLWESKIITIQLGENSSSSKNVFYILGAFSENLVPNIFSKFEDKAIENN